MLNIKSPGPDRYPAEFYKHFWPLMSPLFHRMIAEILSNSMIPHHVNTALITLPLKQHKDSTMCSGYCPLSLINTDVKIMSKSLAI